MRSARLALFVLTVSLLAARTGGAEEAAQPAAAEPGIVTLRDAARQGLLEARGTQPASYKRVHLEMRNVSEQALRVDVCGSYLVPKRSGSCQRLGLGPVVTPRLKKRRTPEKNPRPPQDRPAGTVLVSLDPGEARTLHLNTCCLDAGRPAPSHQTFRVAHGRLPPVREKVLRWWADNPHAPQGAVNAAIWKFRETVQVPEGGDPQREPGKGVAAHAGIVYRLRGGELMARDADGIDRFLGTEILSVHPTDTAVFAEALGPRRGAARGRELWRLVLTGDEPWRLVAHLPALDRIRELFVSPGGAILLTTDRALYRVDPERKALVELLKTEDPANLSVRFAGRRILVTQRLKSEKGYYQGGELKGEGMAVCQLWQLDAKANALGLVRDFWNIGHIQAGPAGLYALSPAGKLRRLVGRSFRNAPGHRAYERIAYVGRKSVGLVDKSDRIVAVDRSGRPRFETGACWHELMDASIDRHTDDLVFVRDGRFYRVDAKTGAEEELDPRARRQGR
jgi:hypothetical protein